MDNDPLIGLAATPATPATPAQLGETLALPVAKGSATAARSAACTAYLLDRPLSVEPIVRPILRAGGVPLRFLRRLAAKGVIPAADITLRRPVVGRFFRFVAKDVVSVSRRRDATWEDVLRRVGPDSLLVLAPEGRMKRANGLDKDGRPMTVRGGIAPGFRETQRRLPRGD